MYNDIFDTQKQYFPNLCDNGINLYVSCKPSEVSKSSKIKDIYVIFFEKG